MELSNIKLIADEKTMFSPESLYFLTFPYWDRCNNSPEMYAFGADLHVFGCFLNIKKGFKRLNVTNETSAVTHNHPYFEFDYREDLTQLTWGNANIEIRLVESEGILGSKWYSKTKEQAEEAKRAFYLEHAIEIKAANDKYNEERRKEMDSVPGREECLEDICREIDALGKEKVPESKSIRPFSHFFNPFAWSTRKYGK